MAYCERCCWERPGPLLEDDDIRNPRRRRHICANCKAEVAILRSEGMDALRAYQAARAAQESGASDVLTIPLAFVTSRVRYATGTEIITVKPKRQEVSGS
jgi:hypothetical protein